MAKIGIISDIHANLPALEAVLEFLDNENPDYWVCLGDIVGYGPNPKECIEIIRAREIPTVLGNHDAGVAGRLSTRFFRDPNRKLIELTKELISEDDVAWLSSLPYVLENDSWVAVHAHPSEPEKWQYVDSAIKARRILENLETDICFLGHTHVPGIVSNRVGVNSFRKGFKYIINPGSVGQSRDEDFRASCCIIDTENYTYLNKRLEYNTEKVLTDLTKLGFTRKEAHHLLRV